MLGSKAFKNAQESLQDTHGVLRIIAGVLMLILAVLVAGMAK